MANSGPDSRPFSALRERLSEINYWWPESDAEFRRDRPGSIPTERSWNFYKSDFFGAVEKLAWDPDYDDEVRLFAIAGPENTGKTTLLSQIVRLFVDTDFRELLWTLPDTADVDHLSIGPHDVRSAWAIDKYHFASKVPSARTDVVSQLRDLGPNRVLYLPLDTDPAFQLRPERQIRDAVDYYETEILDGSPDETQHYIFVDDVHTLTGESRDTSWGEIVGDLLEDAAARKVFVTTVSEESVERELYDPERDEMRLDPEHYRIDSVLPLKFRDYLQRRYPIFEGGDYGDERVSLDYSGALNDDVEDSERDPDAFRISGSTLGNAFLGAVWDDDPGALQDRLHDFEETLDFVYEVTGSGGRNSPRAWIQNALDEYLLLGGYTSLALNEDLFELPDEEYRTYLRSGDGRLGHTFARDASNVLEQTVGAIPEQAPAFESVRQSRIRDLPRLFGWAAHTLDGEPFDYDDLLGDADHEPGWILDVDRRTLREKYFETLEEMVLLTFSDGYGHKKPRELRVALRDVGLANALLWRDLDDVTDTRSSLRRNLEYMVAFDHVMRFSYNVNDDLDPNRGVVRYWKDGDDFVEFVPKLWGAPIPIGLDTGPNTPISKIDAVGRFLDEQSANPDSDLHDFVRYEPVVGEPKRGPSGDLSKVLQWFDRSVASQVEASESIEDLGDLWDVSGDELAAVDGIDPEIAGELVDAVELFDLLTDVRGIGPSKRETLWNPPEELRPSPNQSHWTVEALGEAEPTQIADLPGFTDVTGERVVLAARSRRRQVDGGEYERRIGRLVEGDERWDGIPTVDEDPDGRYRGRYEQYEWGSAGRSDSEDSGSIHHRIHDGAAPFGVVLTKGTGVERYQSPEQEKPIFTVPLWMFLSLV